MSHPIAPRHHARPVRHETAIRLALALGLVLGLAACSPAVGSGAPPGTTPAPPGSPTPSTFEPTPVPTSAHHPSPSPAPTPPSQSRAAWGAIWDALPRGFPTPPAAESTDTGDPEPASATLAVPTAAAATTAWYRSALPAAGYTIEDVNGPYENGGYVVDAVGASSGCRVQVSLTRTGTTTTVTILLAAACPFRV